MRAAHTILTTLLVAVAAATVHGALVTATGRAVDGPTAREQALADALREAVRQGAGVDVASASKVRDFALEFDRVLACSFGHVRRYRVLRQGVDDSGWYTLTVEAEVVKGAPAVDDRMGVQMLIRLRGAPRVMVQTDERLAGARMEQPAAAAVLTQAAVDLGLQVVDPRDVSGNAARRGARAAILGATQEAALRLAETTPEADFLLRAEVSADVGTPQREYGVALRDVAISVNLSAHWADTGTVIVHQALPATRLTSSAPTPAAALQDALKAMLCGPGPDGAPAPVDGLLRAIVARWLVELDLGRLVRAEISQAAKTDFDRMVSDLAETPGIGEVWVRAFDGRHLSVVEFESRLETMAAAEVLRQSLARTHEVDAASAHYVLLVPAGPPAPRARTADERRVEDPNGPLPGAPGPGDGNRGRGKPWPAIVGMIALALASAGAFVIVWRRTRS